MKMIPNRGSVLMAALAAAWLPAGAQTMVYSSGHADIGIAYEGGEFEPHWHMHGDAVVDGSPLGGDAEFGPSAVIALVPNPPVARPAGAQWDFTGTTVGSPLWFLPQGEDLAKPFLGIASEELSGADWSSLTISLVGSSGPAGGEFSLWQSDAFGNPVVRMATANGISGADSFSLNPGGHDHYNYGFTKEGIYELTFRWDGQHVTDGLVSNEATFAFGVTVVPEPGEVGLVAGLGMAGWVAWRRIRRGGAEGSARAPGPGARATVRTVPVGKE